MLTCCRRVEALHRPHQEPALLITISMACRVSTTSSAFMYTSWGGSRAVARLRSSQSFLLFSSRALSCSARNHSTRQRPTLSIQSSKSLLTLHRYSVFSTSSRLDAERKAEKETASQGSPGQKLEVGRSCYVQSPNYDHTFICPRKLISYATCIPARDAVEWVYMTPVRLRAKITICHKPWAHTLAIDN